MAARKRKQGLLARIATALRARRKLVEERDKALVDLASGRNSWMEMLAERETAHCRTVAAKEHELKLKAEHVEFLEEQLAAYRDTLQTFHVEKQLQGAIAKAELTQLLQPRAG